MFTGETTHSPTECPVLALGENHQSLLLQPCSYIFEEVHMLASSFHCKTFKSFYCSFNFRKKKLSYAHLESCGNILIV